jgi:hypothetical protein
MISLHETIDQCAQSCIAMYMMMHMSVTLLLDRNYVVGQWCKYFL